MAHDQTSAHGQAEANPVVRTHAQAMSLRKQHYCGSRNEDEVGLPAGPPYTEDFNPAT